MIGVQVGVVLVARMRPQHITITSIKYLISYPINMKVSNQVFTTSNSNKCVGGLWSGLFNMSGCVDSECLVCVLFARAH